MKPILISIKMLLIMTVITGVVYPLLITFSVQFIFPGQANGSLIMKDGKLIGSSLIGQQFNKDIYFSSRPSIINYNPLPSGASNYGLTNYKLDSLVKANKKNFLLKNQLDNNASIPSEMLFTSGSGLDPHISPKAAYMQVNRISKARNFTDEQKKQLTELITKRTEESQFLLFGDERINVLLLNLELDKIN
jgi:potassium-transporting ATPase KdpC subunit